MARPPDRPPDQLLHCSADRTLVRTVDPESGRPVLQKLFARGSLADAERELALGRELAELEVVRCLDAGLDPVTGVPCLRMEWHTGQNLEALVAERGALPPAEACALLGNAARTLAAMHALRTRAWPHGLAHGDFRPANVLYGDGRTRLLDLEHARPIDPRGAAAALDAAALGEALRFALTGSRTAHPGALAAHDPELTRLIDACTGPQAGVPPVAEVARRLSGIAARLHDDPAEVVLEALQRGDLAAAERRWHDVPPGPRGVLLGARLSRSKRLLHRRPGLLDFAPPGPDPASIRRTLSAATVALRRFPLHRPALRTRAEARAAAVECLHRLPELCADLVRDASFDEAQALVREAEAMVRDALEAPGPLPVPAGVEPRMPTSLQRRPLPVLAQMRADVEAARQEHQAVLDELGAAEGGLDLAAAEAVIERIAAARGGATAVVAQCRDRLHRLAFYLDRLARSRPNLVRLAEMLANAGHAPAVEPALDFLTVCGGQRLSTPQAGEAQTGMGLRGLARALHDLEAEFPALADRTAPCIQALDGALALAADHAWELLAQATDKLQAEPVPVRPLQTVLHRLDALRVLEALVDRPQRPRTQLLDRIETLRMRLDQARSTRDRLARGAELAMARGHWTTGLFDMERAAVHVADEGDDEESAQSRRLQERLAEARRRKEEIEAAVRRNMELARLYAELVDDPAASFEQRLRVLGERRHLLQFLAPRVQAERSRLYSTDLRDVEALIALEQAASAEAQFDRTDDPAQRLLLARRTLEQLAGPATSDAGMAEPPARVLRLLDHWRKLAENAQRELERRQREQQAAARRRLRRRAVVVGAGLLVLAAILLRTLGAL